MNHPTQRSTTPQRPRERRAWLESEAAYVRALHPRVCPLCADSTLGKLWSAMRTGNGGRLPYRGCRRLGVSKQTSYRHAHHPPGHISRPWYLPAAIERNREKFLRYLAPRQWKPGETGGGNRKGAPDRRPRRKPCGIRESILAQREERAERDRIEEAAIVSGTPTQGNPYFGSGVRAFR